MSLPITDGACYVPLGAGECRCGHGDGTTVFISRVDIRSAPIRLIYTFDGDVVPPEVISEPASISMCLSQILNVFIPLAESYSAPDQIMQFCIDGKDVGLEGAKELLAMRKLHTAMYQRALPKNFQKKK